MSIVTKLVRCADCGSTQVKEDNGVYRCRACGAALDHPMAAGDMEKIHRALVLGSDSQTLRQLRSRYRNLDITTWSSDERLQQ